MDPDQLELLATFHHESLQRVAEAESALLASEAGRLAAEQCLGELFRHFHTLKGDAGLVECRGIVELAHAAEERLDQLRRQVSDLDAECTSTLLEVLDAIRLRLGDSPGAADPELDDRERDLCARLRRVGSATESTRESTSGDSASSSSFGHRRDLRIGIDKLDAMLRICGEINVLHGRTGQILTAAGDRRPELLETHRLGERLFDDLQQLVMAARLVPLATSLLRPCQRLVRDLSRETGKPVRLESEGADVEIDTAMVEPLREALIHMIRNSVDHGIEERGERLATGKNEQASIRISARRESGALRLRVSDDGAGLPVDRLKARAAALGLATAGSSDLRQIHDLIFLPGVSTAASVSRNSGRGVGMDVVRKNVELLRGHIAVESQPGRGTAFEIRLPLSLSIMNGFVVAIGDETYVLPMEAVRECLSLESIAVLEGSEVAGIAEVRGAALPFLRLGSWFHPGSSRPRRENLVVLDVEGTEFGLAVDRLLGETQAMIRPLAEGTTHAREISGSTIRGDGSVALIVDVNVLATSALEATGRRAAPTTALAPQHHLETTVGPA